MAGNKLFIRSYACNFRAVFKWLSKNQNQSSYSDQSQQEQTARWTNHNSSQLSVTHSTRGKNHAYMVRLVLVLLLIGWKTGASLLSQSLNVAIAITIARNYFRQSFENCFNNNGGGSVELTELVTYDLFRCIVSQALPYVGMLIGLLFFIYAVIGMQVEP